MRSKYTKRFKYDGFGTVKMTLKYAAHYMREQHRRKNFKIGDACDGMNINYVVQYCTRGGYKGHVTFYEEYYTDATYILKYSVYTSKLVNALCVN